MWLKLMRLKMPFNEDNHPMKYAVFFVFFGIVEPDIQIVSPSQLSLIIWGNPFDLGSQRNNPGKRDDFSQLANG